MYKLVRRSQGYCNSITFVVVDGNLYVPSWKGRVWGPKTWKGGETRYSSLYRTTRIRGVDLMESPGGRKLIPLKLEEGQTVHPLEWNQGKAFIEE